MKWILNRRLRFGLLLLVVFCCSSWVYGLDLKGKTPEEIANLADITKAELQAILSENESLTTERNDYRTKFLQSEEKRIQEAETYSQDLTQKDQELASLRIESQLRTQSYERYESETVWTKIGIFGAGMCLGAWADNYIRDWTEYAQSIEAVKATE